MFALFFWHISNLSFKEVEKHEKLFDEYLIDLTVLLRTISIVFLVENV